ncbi:MAG: glycine--tRNA ligase subunit beta [Alphaproteobacteria bacterium]|jgi:glycyl-tRNA synthetase beta chain|nr:glycine--tRNA ligase subunit beta [Alphaproteobacteria bacterium]
MSELLLEVLCEEIPARFQKKAALDFERLAGDTLSKMGLTFTACTAYISPRRLALVVTGLPAATPAVTQERKGPKVDAPDHVIQGFLKSVGLTLEDCTRQETPKGTFLMALKEIPSQKTQDVLGPIFEELLVNFPWPQTMRWGCGTKGWVRPVHSLLAIFEGAVIPMTLRFGEKEGAPTIVSGNTTCGHRFLEPRAIKVTNASDYLTQLKDAYVMVDAQARKEMITTQLSHLVQEKGLVVKDDPGLLEEVAGLVEWPVVHLGTIASSYMVLPPEVLITTMRVHQRYFALENAKGALAPFFGFAANTVTSDEGHKVVQGNERVLKARLSDALFFYTQDQKVLLEEHADALSKITFHAKLGTLAQKRDRLEVLAKKVAGVLGFDQTQAALAARLCKADLVTGMVYEFPELQGIMGGYYARSSGYGEEVAAAIAQQYQPKGPEDALPGSLLGLIVALVDRLDTLTGFCAVGIMPTGSGDPFALRRAALGIIRILENEMFKVSLPTLLGWAYDLYAPLLQASGEKILTKEATLDTLLSFMKDRIKVLWRDQGIRHDYVEALLNVVETPLSQFYSKLTAFQNFVQSSRTKAQELLEAYRRGANIVRIEEEKDGRSYADVSLQESLMGEVAEKNLFNALKRLDQTLTPLLETSRYAETFDALLSLCEPLDEFFTHVTVNAPQAEVRQNRLALLARLKVRLEKVAAFSTLEDL